ncbi:hypothetical protein LguiB_012770 [Lonicera macranthoides]
MEVTDYTIDDFLRDMGRPLQYREPTTINNFWVFWSQEEGEGEDWPHHPQSGDLGSITKTFTNNNCGDVQEYLKYILCNAEDTGWANVALIQFWTPTTTTTTSMIGGCCVVKTSNQPFALYGIGRRLCEYKIYCTSLEFNIFQDEEKEYEDNFGCIIGQVFREKEAKFIKHNLPGDFAHKCGMRRCFFLPIFKPSGRCCSGVLEISFTSESSLFDFGPYELVKAIFKVRASLVLPIFPQ